MSLSDQPANDANELEQIKEASGQTMNDERNLKLKLRISARAAGNAGFSCFVIISCLVIRASAFLHIFIRVIRVIRGLDFG